MIDLEAALFDLAEHLDHPAAADMGDAVRRRIAVAPPRSIDRRPGPRTRRLIAIAAAVVLIVAAVVTISPARHAIADWLGIGAVEVRHTGQPLPTGTGAHPVPGAPGSTAAAPARRAAAQLAAARRAVGFAIETPHSAAAGSLAGVEVDKRVRGGLVVLRYPRFTLIEIATIDTGGPTIGKLLDPTARAEDVTVAGAKGMWITGAHQIGYLDRSGQFETDTVRRAGPVLLWARAGVTYRIEGLARLADAQSMAASVR